MTKSLKLSDIEAAASRLQAVAVRTPLLRSSHLDCLTGARVYLKPESLQRTGSFKFRGAYNALSAIAVEERSAGVVAASSGNHAQGVALAAKLLGMRSTIIMPEDAPKAKIASTKRYGAEVVLYDRATTDREALSKQVHNERGGSFVHPFDNMLVMAGQGTAGLEAAQDLLAIGEKLDAAFVCCSGGGFATGVGTALKAHFADVQLYTAEPEGFDDMRRSLLSGQYECNLQTAGSLQDALLVRTPGQLTFPQLQAMGARGVCASDAQAMAAVAYAFRELKLVVEPGGACALGHVLHANGAYEGQTLLVTLSGGNIDTDIMLQALQASA
jgi:threonine dehydratase